MQGGGMTMTKGVADVVVLLAKDGCSSDGSYGTSTGGRFGGNGCGDEDAAMLE